MDLYWTEKQCERTGPLSWVEPSAGHIQLLDGSYQTNSLASPLGETTKTEGSTDANKSCQVEIR